MSQLFAIIFRYRVFLLFLFLEIVAAGLIVNNNSYQRSIVLSSSNTLVGGIYNTTSNVTQYFNLTEVNEGLLDENAILRKQIELLQVGIASDSVTDSSKENITNLFYGMSDTVAYDFIPARVINNSMYRMANYITLNKGRKDGIEPGMGIMTQAGVVGQVKTVSDNFATCYSLLHREMNVSAELKRTGDLCTVKWDTQDPTTASANYLPLHLDINVGDTITTSGFNTVYPEGVMLGVVSEASRVPSERFWLITIDVSVDFSKLHHVYVSKSLFRAEKDSLENIAEE
ncbi:rod shape-determining protein MreC [Flammeovirga yaeyamensis]|uniref:Cell shape-determining protein MreC n=1 Tax=Flammeovirga yaeyamensis TaxID=367791 RepID=A0AAX1N8I9_9BACT|nr:MULTISPECIES: rod shape-determining protein MreC [Flammeovirga]ANQ50214.2 rod shape-determining protein MreC [Flammeovirga sp. MY04]MBB3699825.1 rod shape-determining protein MreC [Flammeovirga yaeyamensis]NMF36606.1 rod shape-determining protein MreC [Flammeovirga yaeyamensis]QWG02347.1 rod shape-determining protein MreC [Flammeovirga yaeyamensis]